MQLLKKSGGLVLNSGPIHRDHRDIILERSRKVSLLHENESLYRGMEKGNASVLVETVKQQEPKIQVKNGTDEGRSRCIK